MSPEPPNNLNFEANDPKIQADILRDRAYMLDQSRRFFSKRNILEVDCGALVKRAPIDSNIDVISASVSTTQTAFLHTSPEYAMKRLLSTGIGDIFFLGHVFRQGEIGRLHNPEFTMAEWYRIGLSFSQIIEETSDYLTLFLGNLPTRIIGYREAFEKYANINYAKDPLTHLLPAQSSHWSRTEGLHYILSHIIEPHLGKNELTVLTDYPPYEAALACLIEKEGEQVAERFEIYHNGVELANGYHELADPQELKRRFTEENKQRAKRNQEIYTLDEEFLSALENGFPDCCGVSVGFDRAFMLRRKAPSLASILPFSWTPSR